MANKCCGHLSSMIWNGERLLAAIRNYERVMEQDHADQSDLDDAREALNGCYANLEFNISQSREALLDPDKGA